MSSPKNPLVHFHKTIWFALAVFAMLILVFFFYVRAEKQIDRVNDLRHLSLQLSDELRQSSDDLTRMVRTYVVTGSPAYKQHFQDILAIRNGYKPRPVGYQGVYWDLILGDEPLPAASEEAVPLLELMRRARYTEEEFAKLAEAKTNSDALTDTEFAAMALIESIGPGQAARRERAITMVHDAIYHQAKADIMRPISEFQQMIEVRTNKSVEAAQDFAAQMRVVLIVIACLQILALWWAYRALHETLGGTVKEIHAHISRLGRGDFSSPIVVDETRADSVLGWLGEMRGRLEQTEAERIRSEAQINDLAFFDQLSGLPNRVLLMDRLKQALANSSRRGKYGALLFIDLDNFKVLNDTKGHEMGDLLLKLVAERLKQCVRDGDTVARVGGDEFVVVLSDLGAGEKESATATEAVAEKILNVLNQSYRIGELVHRSSASIGATLFLDLETPVDDLMKQADLAMYRAKDAGRNVVRFFDPAMEAAVKTRAEMEEDLRRAVADGHFLLHYQAQLVGERVIGAEALVRWQHPVRGMIAPADFIPLAEDSDLIVPLGLWVLRTACTQLTRWARRPQTAHLTIAVNVSAKQFRQSDFVAQVLAVIQETGANPYRLKLELTESLLVHNVEDIIEKMYALKAKGVGFSLDDFGTGYSSLVYLKRLPLDQLKIDQSFVRDLLSDPNDAAIARTIVALAQSLGLAVIAEGVETQEQQDFLAGVGCYAYQGYLFGRPVAIEVFERDLIPKSLPA